MKKKVAKTMSIFLSINIIFILVSFAFNVSCKADILTPWSLFISGVETVTNRDYSNEDMPALRAVLDLTVLGIMYSLPPSSSPSLEEYCKQYIADKNSENVDDISDEDVWDWASDNLTLNSNNTVTVSNDYRNYANYVNNQIINSSKFSYGYTINLSKHNVDFLSNNYSDCYNGLKNICSTYQDNYFIGFGKLNKTGSYVPTVFLVDKSNSCFVYYNNVNVYTPRVTFYSLNDLPSLVNNGIAFKWFKYTDNSWNEFSPTNTSVPEVCVNKYSDYESLNLLSVNSRMFLIKYGLPDDIMYYANTTSLLENFNSGIDDIKPYYYNNQIWNDFSNPESSTSYVFDSSNSNNVTYGDIESYINSFNTENGTNPTLPQINNYIEQKNNQIINGSDDDSGGSGSGGSGGSGSGGSDDDSGGIFDFLSNIGEVLGNLISNLSQTLAELISGVVEAISSVLEAIPNVFTPLISYIFGWLPESVQALVVLGITAMIIIGIVKMIRG